MPDKEAPKPQGSRRPWAAPKKRQAAARPADAAKPAAEATLVAAEPAEAITAVAAGPAEEITVAARPAAAALAGAHPRHHGRGRPRDQRSGPLVRQPRLQHRQVGGYRGARG